MVITDKINATVIKSLRNGCIGVIPTDTIYGIVGTALSKDVVGKIYKLRKRNLHKPMIVLIGSIRDLKSFDVALDSAMIEQIKKLWPGTVSIILPCASKKFSYLHRGTKTIAFRLPANTRLQTFLKKTGPLVAPSANWEGMPPARTIAKARSYFGDKVDFYLDGGRVSSKPSTVLIIDKNGRSEIIRK